MLEKLADMAGVTPQVLIVTIVVLAIAFILVWIKISIDEKKGVNSKEKEEIRKIITHLVPDGGQYTAAYAHSKEVYGGARMRREVYRYYAVGFRPDQTDHVWVVPIGVEGDKIVYTEPVRAGAENLEYIGGGACELLLKFPGRRDDYYKLSVSASNTRMGKECQVNIQQPDEAKAWSEFAPAFQERVNAALGVDKKGRALRQ